MENQHRKITGYRELDQNEINLMNEIKALGPLIENVIIKVNDHVSSQRLRANGDVYAPDESLLQRLDDATPERFVALAKTDFQTALMYLVRSVAQPTTF